MTSSGGTEPEMEVNPTTSENKIVQDGYVSAGGVSPLAKAAAIFYSIIVIFEETLFSHTGGRMLWSKSDVNCRCCSASDRSFDSDLSSSATLFDCLAEIS